MCTSVPQTPARRTLINTSSSRIVGTGTFLSTKPGPAVSFTSAFIWWWLWDRAGNCSRESNRRRGGNGRPESWPLRSGDGSGAVAGRVLHDRLDLSAVHLDRSSRHEARALRREKRHDRRHLLRIALTSDGNAVGACLEQLVDRTLLSFRAHACELECTRRVEVSRKDRVDEHIVARALVGERLGETEETGARGIREDEAGNGLLRRHRGEEDDSTPLPLSHAGHAG